VPATAVGGTTAASSSSVVVALASTCTIGSSRRLHDRTKPPLARSDQPAIVFGSTRDCFRITRAVAEASSILQPRIRATVRPFDGSSALTLLIV
jgi:hypothetical protein